MKKLTVWIITGLLLLCTTISSASPKSGKASKKPTATATQPTNQSTSTPAKKPTNILTPSQEIKELFDENNPRKTLTINGKELQQLPSSQGLTRVFSGANDNEVKEYFSKLTGQPLPSPRKIPNKGTMYVAPTTNGSFNLRDFATSSEKTGSAWTIDIPTGVVHPKKAEIKFIR